MSPARRRYAVLRAVAALVIVAVAFDRQVLHRRDGGPLGSDLWGTAAATNGDVPPVHLTEHPTRLLPAVSPPAGAGGFTVEFTHDGTPVRFDPCRPVHYVVSGAEPFGGATDMLRGALADASAASGLEFVDDGLTTEPAATHRPAYQPERYGKQWAPVLLAWTDAGTIPRLAGGVVGVGGPIAAPVHDQWRTVSGVVYLDAPDLALAAMRGTGYAVARTVMLHEIGHLLGLGHVDDPHAVMYPSSGVIGAYTDGDLRGLAAAGSAACSRYS